MFPDRHDDLTVEYIYSPLHDLSPEDEARRLDEIAARAEMEPGLVYDAGGLGGIDPTTNSDDLGDDPVAFAESRLRMVREEVLPQLPDLVLGEGHDDSHVRQALDAAVFSVCMDYVDMLCRHVGGQIILRRVSGSEAARAGPPPVRTVGAEVQRRALDVLGQHLFAPGALGLLEDIWRTLGDLTRRPFRGRSGHRSEVSTGRPERTYSSGTLATTH